MEWIPGTPRPMSEEDLKAWEGRVSRAQARRQTYEGRWQSSLERYFRSKADNYDVNALLDFRHVETKKAQLFYQTPEVQLHPIDPQNPELPGLALLPLRQKVLNHTLGPDGTDVKRAIHETLFDCLAASGFLVVEIGYDVRTAQDPMTGMATPIWGKPFLSRVSPKKLLIPDDFRSTQFDRAPWLGVSATMPLTRAKIAFQLEEDFTASAQKDEHVFEHAEAASGGGDQLVEYTTIWYRAEDFDGTIVNPELYRRLILVKGLEQPAQHVDSPFQAIDEVGQLTPMSMRGNPIHVGTLRDLSDAAYVPSDLQMGEQLANEVNKFRTQLIRNRVARTPFNLIDPDGFPPGEVDKIKAGEKTVFTKPGELMAGRIPILAVQPGQEPRDNYTAQDYAERDWQGALGTADNQSGQLSKKKTTATEARITQTNSGARAEAEKDRLREYFIAAVRKFDTVLAWTMMEADLIRILGSQGAALWAQFRELAGCYVYKVLPDSGIHVDAAQFRAQKLDEYNLLRKDPQINPAELLNGVVRALGYDPAKVVLPQAPEAGPDPAKVSFAFKGEDFVGPQAPIVAEICVQAGYTISPSAIQQTTTAVAVGQAMGQLGPDGKPAAPIGDASKGHGGSASVTEPVNQHQTERTGGVQGVGVQ